MRTVDDGCPSVAELEAFLAGSEPATVGVHLLACQPCRARAERLSDDETLRSWVSALAARPATHGDDQAALARLIHDLSGPGEPESGRLHTIAPPEELGPFTVETELGRGGMGVVYRARDRRTGRLVALKILRPELADGSSRQRFEQEARAAARVEHDHVVRLYDTSDPSEPAPYLVMEYVAGPSLAEELKARGRLNPREAARVIGEAADGLAAAHAAGLVHRDVKPGNILLERATGRARIGDFGLARLAAEAARLTREGVVTGTPAYLSPEQASGDPDAGPASDVYALGVCLYECLAGEPPFRGTPHLVIEQILRDDPRPPRALNDAVPRELETVCLKAMSREPARRYATASDLASDLRRWSAGEPVVARPIGPAVRLWRRARRQPKTAVLILLLCLVTAAGAGGVLWQWQRAEASGRQARASLRRSINAADTYFTKVSESRLLNVPGLQPLRREMLEAARDFYETLLRERPDDVSVRAALAQARHRLAIVYNTLDRPSDAISTLESALAEFDRLLRVAPNDSALRRARSACLASRSRVQMYASQYEQSQKGYQAILEDAEAWRRLRPDDPGALESASEAVFGLGELALVQGRKAEAVDYFERALAIARDQKARQPGEIAHERMIASIGIDLADAYRLLDRAQDQFSALESGYQSARQVVERQPEGLSDRETLALYEGRRAEILGAQAMRLRGEAAKATLREARRALEAGLVLMRPMVRDNPLVGSLRGDLVFLLSRSVAVAYFANQPDEAIALMRECRDVVAAAPVAERIGLFTKTSFATALGLGSAALAETGRKTEALEVLSEGKATLATLAKGDQPLPLARFLTAALASQHALILLDDGRARESLAFWELASQGVPEAYRPIVVYLTALARHEAGDGPPPSPELALATVPAADILYLADVVASALAKYAQIYTQASLARTVTEPTQVESLRARALTCLERARDIGYFRIPAHVAGLRANPALAPLRTRPDFAAFLSTVELK
ncbi:MAG: protein kinase [Isosphaeraceae bacterium]